MRLSGEIRHSDKKVRKCTVGLQLNYSWTMHKSRTCLKKENLLLTKGA